MSVALGGRSRGLLLVQVCAQVAIVVTGGLVRLTGSGLGCPSWPDCTDGSLVPVAHQAQGFHRYIEFGNRMLTFAVVTIAIVSLVVVLRQRPRRRPLVVLAGIVVVGIVAQAVIGGISVLTGLNPTVVALHFVVSLAMIATALVLYVRAGEPSDGPTRATVRDELRILARTLAVLAAAVLVAGTVVTGSGPHSGDAAATVRFHLDPRVASMLHADLVILFIGLTVAMWLGTRLTKGPPSVMVRCQVLLLVSLAQGVLGYVQYFTGVPEVLVAFHILGACLVWVAALALLLSTRERVAEATRGAGERNIDPLDDGRNARRAAG